MKAKMPLRMRIIIGGLVIAVVVGIVIFRFTRPSSQPVLPPAATLAGEIEQALSLGRPTLFVFTYRANCCEATKSFFTNYEASVSAVAGPFADAITTVWIDTGTKDQADYEAMAELASRYDVRYLPSLLLVDSRGEKLWLGAGPVDSEVLRTALAAATQGG